MQLSRLAGVVVKVDRAPVGLARCRAMTRAASASGSHAAPSCRAWTTQCFLLGSRSQSTRASHRLRTTMQRTAARAKRPTAALVRPKAEPKQATMRASSAGRSRAVCSCSARSARAGTTTGVGSRSSRRRFLGTRAAMRCVDSLVVSCGKSDDTSQDGNRIRFGSELIH